MLIRGKEKTFIALSYNVEAWIFDLDGTLIDSHAKIAEVLLATLYESNCQIENPREIEGLIGLSLNQILTKLGVPCTIHKYVAKQLREKLYAEYDHPCILFPGVLDVLQTLRESGKKIGIATNKPTNMAKKIVANSGLVSLVDVVIGSTGLQPKPAPDTLLAVMNLLDSKALMVGDRNEDVVAASSAGIGSIRIDQSLKVSDTENTLNLDSMATLGVLLKKV